MRSRPGMILWVALGLLVAAGCGGTIVSAADDGPGSAEECFRSRDCDDGNPCTEDLCENGVCGHTTLADGEACDDGQACTTGDACQAGRCAGTPLDCTALGDFCNDGICSEAHDQCEPVEKADGTGCTEAYCFVSQTCLGGTCQGGTPRSCADADSCTSDLCNEGTNQCDHPTRVIDPASPVATSSRDGTPLGACLVQSSGARALVWTDLRDTTGAPFAGATVTIGGAAATESAARPGTYYREVIAGGVVGALNLEVVASGCAQTVTLAAQPTITTTPANATAGGTGGCTPTDGNLRVTVIAAETGAPINGAAVIVGAAEGTPFEHAAEAGFGGSGTPASNVATTDANGRAVFYDYGPALAGPVTVTAGAASRSYFTLASGNASDVVLPLRLLHPPAVPSTVYSGTGTASLTGCSKIDMGMVLPKLSLDFSSAFDLSGLLMKNKCWDPGAVIAPTPIPSNVWIPQQLVGAFDWLCIGGGTLAESRWSLELRNTAATGQTENLELVLASAPYQDVQNALAGGGMPALLALLTYQRAGWVLNETVPRGNPNNLTVNANEDYPNTYTVTYSGKPTETDITGITLGDYAGQNGTGPLMLLGTKVHAYNAGGSTVAIPNSDLSAAGAPAGVRRLASIVASYLDRTVHPTIPENRRTGITTVLVRDDGSGGAPFDASGGTGQVTDFLGLAGTTFTPPATFTWENATATGNAPLYSVHELAVRSHKYLPVLTACATENEIRNELSVQWTVVRPFGASCAGQECFTLPTLPASFPRQGDATRKKSGFEQLVGTGAACTGTGQGNCTVTGETCVDPDGAGGSAGRMCMGGAGTDGDPYYTQDYYWWLHLYDLELAPSFDFNAFAFASRVQYLTHESSNEAVFQ